MSDLRFYHTNVLAIAGALKNGDGGGAPAVDEDPEFPMSNLENADRYSIWKNDGTPPSPLNVDFAFASSTTLRLVGMANYDPAWSGATVAVYYSTSAYLPGGWTLLATLTIDATKTNAVSEVNIASVRSLRFECTSPPAGKHVGNFVACTGLLDPGNEGAAGTGEEVLKNRSRARTIGGLPVINRLGGNRSLFTIQWPVVDATIRGHMDTLIALDDTFFLKWLDGRYIQATFADDLLRKTRVYSPQELNELAPVFEELI